MVVSGADICMKLFFSTHNTNALSFIIGLTNFSLNKSLYATMQFMHVKKYELI